MRIFKRDALWDTLDDVGHYNGSIPWYSTWRSRRFAAVMFWIMFFLAIAAYGLYNENKKNTTWPLIKYNDKIFADTSAFFRDSAGRSWFPIFRRIRLINANDIKKMDLAEWEKRKMISQLDQSKDYNQTVMENNVYAELDSMFKFNTAYIGSLIKKDSTTARYYSDNSGSELDWYAIKLNFSVIATSPYSPPEGYVFADSLYYVDVLNVSLKDACHKKNK